MLIFHYALPPVNVDAWHAARYMMLTQKRKNSLPEAAAWLLGLSALALMEPDGVHLFSFCPFSWLWAEGCWGCGLGHAIAYMCRGEWRASWEAHPLALPAVLILLHRCWQLLAWQQKGARISTSETEPI